MGATQTGDQSRDPARVYDEFWVPALFGPWAARLAEASGARRGERVLDVACGTGACALAALERVGPEGRVVGLDADERMLAIAAEKSPRVEWRHGDAAALPFEDAGFDRVLCQFSLMFFPDPEAALREMLRVVGHGGRIAVAVWDRVERVPGYAALIQLLERTMGSDAGEALRSPFRLGDVDELITLFERAGAPAPKVRTLDGRARFPSLREWLTMEVRGWVALQGPVDEDAFANLLATAETELEEFVGPDGSVDFALPAHIVTVDRD